MARLRAAAALLAALAFALAARAVQPVVVVYGEKSNAQPAERRVAESLAHHAARWYRDGGLEADVASDANLAATLAGRKVATLVYCGEPPAAQVAAIRAFVKGGGRLIVAYSNSRPLADVVGVRLGGYKKTPDAAQMRFEESRPANVPAAIAQVSANIVEAFPVLGRSRVLAWWADRSGKRTGDAAWLAGDGGYWMTHVLLADGDALGKGRLLVALAASLAPELWRAAAANRLAAAGKVGPWNGAASALDYIARLRQGPRCARARALAAKAEETRQSAVRLAAAGRGAEAWRLANDYRLLLTEAYGVIQSPSPGEIHAVWDHSGQGLYPGDWPRTCRLLSDAGITDILVNVAAPGYAHCDLKTLPRSPVFDARGDQLQACIDAAHRHGIRVHAWLICFSPTGATKSRLETFRRDGWLLDATDGGKQDWLDPSALAVRARLVAAAKEILTRYRVDGLHLDFVRYPDYYGSLGYATRVRFERDTRGGRAVANWKEAARKRPLFDEVVRWRASQVTALVAEIRVVQRKVAPRALLSAAVLGRYPTCVESVGQDWMAWLECGYLDYAMPMNYTENGALYTELLAGQLKTKTIARKIVGGIGVTAAESRLGAAEVIDQVKPLRKGGAAGFALFDLDATLQTEILPILNLGITSRPKGDEAGAHGR